MMDPNGRGTALTVAACSWSEETLRMSPCTLITGFTVTCVVMHHNTSSVNGECTWNKESSCQRL